MQKARYIDGPPNIAYKILVIIPSKAYLLPLYSSRVSAGFPSPSDEYIEMRLDLNKYLVKNPPATFFIRAVGDSMNDAGIYADDILIVDRSLEPKSGKIVIAAIDGNLIIKRFYKDQSRIILKSENKKYSDIAFEEYKDLIIWGVVTNVIHKV